MSECDFALKSNNFPTVSSPPIPDWPLSVYYSTRLSNYKPTEWLPPSASIGPALFQPLWYRDSKGNWIAEEGDTYQTYLEDTGAKIADARRYFIENFGTASLINGNVLKKGSILFDPGLENKFRETADVILFATGMPGITKRVLRGATSFFSKKGGKTLVRIFSKKEDAIAEYLRQFGRKIQPNLREGVAGAGRQGDAIIDGVLHEFKTLDQGATSATIKNVVNNSIRKGGQARNIVIDARGTGISAQEAQHGINKALGIVRGSVDKITVIGDGFFINGAAK